MMNLNVLLTDIERAFSQGRHVHITEQHLARVGVAHNGITIEAFKAIADRLNCNFYVGREDKGWLRGGGVEAKEGEYGYVFCYGPCAEAGFSYQGYPKFIWEDSINREGLKTSRARDGIAAPPESARIGMAGISGQVCGGPTPFQQWAKLNLGFYLHLSDAAETAIGYDSRTHIMQDGTWLLRKHNENMSRVARVEEITMWKAMQEWWNIMGEVQAMIPSRAQ